MAELLDIKLNEQPEAVANAIFSIIQYMADLDEDAAAEAPSFSDSPDDTEFYDNIIIKLTINNLGLPRKTSKIREFISWAYHKKYSTAVLKNAATADIYIASLFFSRVSRVK